MSVVISRVRRYVDYVGRLDHTRERFRSLVLTIRRLRKGGCMVFVTIFCLQDVDSFALFAR